VAALDASPLAPPLAATPLEKITQRSTQYQGPPPGLNTSLSQFRPIPTLPNIFARPDAAPPATASGAVTTGAAAAAAATAASGPQRGHTALHVYQNPIAALTAGLGLERLVEQALPPSAPSVSATAAAAAAAGSGRPHHTVSHLQRTLALRDVDQIKSRLNRAAIHVNRGVLERALVAPEVSFNAEERKEQYWPQPFFSAPNNPWFGKRAKKKGKKRKGKKSKKPAGAESAQRSNRPHRRSSRRWRAECQASRKVSTQNKDASCF
jgi:hypothetical protein